MKGWKWYVNPTFWLKSETLLLYFHLIYKIKDYWHPSKGRFQKKSSTGSIGTKGITGSTGFKGSTVSTVYTSFLGSTGLQVEKELLHYYCQRSRIF